MIRDTNRASSNNFALKMVMQGNNEFQKDIIFPIRERSENQKSKKEMNAYTTPNNVKTSWFSAHLL